MMDFGIVDVAAITVIAYFVGTIVKNISLDDKWIPVCCGATGLILGLVAFYTHMPDMPASDPITAAAIGVVSGLAATGVNQMYRQLSSHDSD